MASNTETLPGNIDGQALEPSQQQQQQQHQESTGAAKESAKTEKNQSGANSGEKADDQGESTEQRNRVDIAQGIIQIILPVTICALYCCLLIRIISWNLTPSEPNILDSAWRQLGLEVSDPVANQALSSGIANYLIIVGIFSLLIVSISLLMLFIFYMGWQRCLVYYFYLPPAIVLLILTPAFFRTLFQALNWFAMDIYTILLFTWNFGALGMMSIFSLWAQTPLKVQQFYLIHNSVILSVLIIHTLPGWAPWLLLAFLVLWDLFAVLAPIGPLNLILSLAERQGVVDMPGLIYSTDRQASTGANEPNRDPKLGAQKSVSAEAEVDSTVGCTSSDQSSKTVDLITIKSDVSEVSSLKKNPEPVESAKKSASSGNRSQQSDVSATIVHDEIDRGVSIGLGDFIFYSLLIGLTSKGRDLVDFHAVLSALVSIQFGLILTLLILAVRQHPLPALPISIGIGLTMAGLTIQFGPSFANQLSSAAIFI